LKPENILIDKQGYIRLIDFGLSCYASKMTDHTVSKISGTPEYLPPESFSSKDSISTSIDWWSFGSLIFEMVVGFPPFYKHNQSIGEMK
jgi:protein kinase A